MKISIVVPVYNAEKYLEECIESVLNQTVSDWELILVDDGSTDNSAKICDSFANKYPDKIYSFHKVNEGQFLTRQYGIEKCSGDYIGFLDADDLLNKNYVETIFKFIEVNGFYDVLSFNFARFNEAGLSETKNLQAMHFQTPEEVKMIFGQIIDGTLTGSMCSKIFKKELIKSVGIEDGIVSEKRYGEDAFQSFAILLNANRISFLEDCLYFYRDNPKGFSQGFEQRDFEYFNTKYVFELLEDFLLKKYPDNTDFFNRLYARNFNETVYYILKFYRSAKNKARKKQAVEYDWSSFLLSETLKKLDDNTYVRKGYVKVWTAFTNKAYFEIYIREKFKRIIGW